MKKTLLITGLVPGYPNAQTSIEIAKTCARAGADILELSASFSEPIADGKTLQLAHSRVLKSGFSKNDAFKTYQKIKQQTSAPLFLIEYANIIYHNGIENYCKKLSAAGINYLAIPDVPIEESIAFAAAAQKNNIAYIFLIAPTTPITRMKKIIRAAQNAKQNKCEPANFLYLVSVTGVTGKRDMISPSTVSFIKRVRKFTAMPLIVGFGISNSVQVKTVINAGANGIVTCSPIVEMAHKIQNNNSALFANISRYIKQLLNFG